MSALSEPAKQLRRDIRSVCLCLAAFILTMNFAAAIFFAVVAVFQALADPALMEQLLAGNSAFLEEQLTQDLGEYIGLATLFGMLCGLPWFLLIRGKRLFSTDISRRHSPAKPLVIIALLVIMLGAQGFMILLQLGLELLFSQGADSIVSVMEESTTALVESGWGVLYAVLFGPIIEELVFRGAIMRKLEKHGANFAILVSSLLFGVYHIILFQAAFAFLVGLILAYTAGRFSLKWSILLHILNNSLALSPLLLQSELLSQTLSLVYLAALLLAIVLLISGRRLLAVQRRVGAPALPHTYPLALASPWLWLFVLSCLAVGVALQLLPF